MYLLDGIEKIIETCIKSSTVKISLCRIFFFVVVSKDPILLKNYKAIKKLLKTV